MRFKHPIVIEGKMNFDDMDDLVCRLRQGCQDTRDEVIEGFVPLALSLVKQFIAEYPFMAHERDDLCSDAFLKVVLAVDQVMRAEAPATDNIVGYVSVAVTHGLMRYAHKNRTDSVGEVPPSWGRLASLLRVYEQDHSDEILEEVLSVCQTERQRAIVRLRCDGYTDEMIATYLDLGRSTVTEERQAIEERYNDAQST